MSSLLEVQSCKRVEHSQEEEMGVTAVGQVIHLVYSEERLRELWTKICFPFVLQSVLGLVRGKVKAQMENTGSVRPLND